MIVNKFKPCCSECEDIDVCADTLRDTSRNVVGEITKTYDTVIRCIHCYVCKEYIECEDNPNEI